MGEAGGRHCSCNVKRSFTTLSIRACEMPPFRAFLESLSCQVMFALLRFSPGYAMVQEKVVLILALTQLSVAGKQNVFFMQGKPSKAAFTVFRGNVFAFFFSH